MFENPDNEKRVNELEVELSELQDHVDELHEALKLFTKTVADETKTITINMENIMMAISRSSHGYKYDIETVGEQVILTEIPKKPRKLSKKQKENQMKNLEALVG